MTKAAASAPRTTSGRGRVYASILDTIGDTPCVRVNRLAPDGVDIYVKVEAFNPAASVKDRLAVSIIEEAERTGALKPGQTVVEATSGNTGIGLAMVCVAKGYPLVVTMAEQFSVERRRLMRFLGAKVVLTPQAQRGMGMVTKAIELARLLRRLDDAQRQAVLDRAQRVEGLDLDVEVDARRRQPVDLHHRRLADGAENAFVLAHDHSCRLEIRPSWPRAG
jgi:hypothetical protein